MSILESVESRWFFDPADDRVRAIADRFARVRSEGDRVDRYLPTGRVDLGIKVRAPAQKPATLETKWRVEEIGTVELAPGVIGRGERWRKLSVEVEARSVAAGPGEIALSKDRKLRKLEAAGDELREVGPSELPSAGCNVEWTEVKRNGAVAAWTLGFEAFGPSPADLAAILEKAAKAFFAEAPGLALDPNGSMGYAAWVQGYATSRG